MYNIMLSVQISGDKRAKIALINKKLKIHARMDILEGKIIDLVNSRYNFTRVAQENYIYVKIGKKKPNALHPV
ncbi:hypothetical protein NS31R_04445 [Enterobacter cancerogenus]|uniref:hypothetical protein n=2 Tax=Enterobacter cancerogenus TaxID=69218 RepID=UPI000734DCB4|nr:hypothetical protein [Enterobacter cancerogenus]KTQ47343.1 hypothetical protein NS104_12810 [Enterobacter cancerogenus]KTQ54626.1 hypothetical protein NS111_00235 [Enterobacter cancerogenus]KTQ74967.1 hypothetical protein NS188_04345 [Enterobacter cancerogenus]KTQ84041.1 hypothetical protein NS31R_04445 [Enterobacter cancerogenus]